MAGSRPLAVVTGSTGGIGSACAWALAREGYVLGLLGRDESTLARLEGELRAEGFEVHTGVVDLRDERAVPRAVEDIAASGVLRALVNVAGTLSVGTVADVTIRDWDELVAVKLRGTFLTCRAAVPLMARGGGGSIVNVSSMSGRTRGVYSSPAYVAANAGVIGLTMALAAQSGRLGVRVNTVAPGVTRTSMLDVYTSQEQEAMKPAIPLGRFAEPNEIAAAVCFLVSDRAAYITGETLNVNGGMFMG